MREPTSTYQAWTSFSKAARPSCSLVLPSAVRRFSSTFWVAMAAWSVPGSQRTSNPRIRLYRA